MAIVTPSLTYFPDPQKHKPLYNGYLYIGQPDLDPEIPGNQIPVRLRLEDGTEVSVSQPVRTGPGGLVQYEATGAYAVLLADGDYSLKALRSDLSQALYIPNNQGLFDASNITNLFVPDYAALRALPSATLQLGQKIWVDGYSDPWEVTAGAAPTNSGPDLAFDDTTSKHAVYTGEIISIKLFGATANDGLTDETSAFIAARDYGGHIQLEENHTYAIASQIAATANGQGFYAPGCGATIILLTGSGQFDRSDYSGTKDDTNAVGFFNSGFDCYWFKKIHVKLQTGNGVRTVKALTVRDCSEADIDVEVSDFTEPQSGIVTVDTINDAKVLVNGHDCGTANDSLPSMQVTVIDVDQDRVASVGTRNTTVHYTARDILLTGAALTKYGQQTDGCNVSGGGEDNRGLVIRGYCERLGEALDIFGSFIVADVVAFDVVAGLKITHGAQNNRVNLTVRNTSGPGLLIGGTDIVPQDVSNNHVTMNVSGIGSGSLTPGALVAVHVDGAGLAQQATHNVIDVVCESSQQMQSVVRFQAGRNNTVNYAASVAPTATPVEYWPTSGPGNIAVPMNKIRNGKKVGRYYNGGTQDLASATLLTMAANTLYATPIRIREEDYYTEFRLDVINGTAGNIRCGIYYWEDGEPTDLLLDIGELDASSGGKEFTVSGFGIYLKAGIYAIATITSGTPGVYSTDSASAAMTEVVGSFLPGTPNSRITASQTYEQLPAVFPALTYGTGWVPNVALRANQ